MTESGLCVLVGSVGESADCVECAVRTTAMGFCLHVVLLKIHSQSHTKFNSEIGWL